MTSYNNAGASHIDVEKKLNAVGSAQRERLAFIDFALYFLGEVTRKDLIDRFAVGHAATTRDFALYKEIAPDNLKLDMRSKKYYKQPDFSPLFNLDLKKTLATISLGYGDGFSGHQDFPIQCESPTSLTVPRTPIMAALCEGIYRNKLLEIEYISTSSGKSRRVIAPHSLVDSGNRWHVRSFDRKNEQFMDVVCNRVTSVTILDDEPITDERIEADRQWQKYIEVKLIPHPHQGNPEAIELDYEMKEGKLTIEVRAALAGYLLRKWEVDCSEDGRLHEYVGYQLALANPQALYQVNSATLAPGYKSKES
ncbi:WYL domain-containing protein [Photobacterium sp. DNB23_23_1]|uniref:WYL domain-containing protein n=1 Tax=Photobacterium pectinilyticum TaxID=2906793 RepID=A0ABT1N7C8_9GAMM|nr:WYL domain-containing protein [Photobacterium sp. ZSDE20]MCQ1059744.1 WYL domain-containing protein [Photobacterium sp. ZSDE20]MDD1825950.1 WYL domain-containing protein [Photobacterium sp. ZSDE20]